MVIPVQRCEIFYRVLPAVNFYRVSPRIVALDKPFKNTRELLVGVRERSFFERTRSKLNDTWIERSSIMIRGGVVEFCFLEDSDERNSRTVAARRNNKVRAPPARCVNALINRRSEAITSFRRHRTNFPGFMARVIDLSSLRFN